MNSNGSPANYSQFEEDPNARGYLIEYHLLDRNNSDPDYIAQRDRMLDQYRYCKANRISQIERFITEGQIGKNLYSRFLGFDCIDGYTRCRTNGDIFDISGKVLFIDKELAKKYNIRCNCPDAISIEVKVLLSDKGGDELRGSQISNINSLDGIISLGGYHSNFYKDTGCPVIHPKILSKEEYQKELKWSHGLGNPICHQLEIDYLTYVFHYFPEYYAGEENRMARYRAAKLMRLIRFPDIFRDYENVILFMANKMEYRFPQGNESIDEFYDRIVKNIENIQDEHGLNLSLDILSTIVNPRLHRCQGTLKEKEDPNKMGNIFDSLLDVSLRKNYLFEVFKDKIIFNNELVKRLGVNKEIPLHDDAFPFLKHIVGGSFYPASNPSFNLHPHLREFCDNFELDPSYVVGQKKLKRSESSRRMRNIGTYGRTEAPEEIEEDEEVHEHLEIDWL
jgi:hypothetical protein